MVREIVEANNWERPIYFAVTCSDDSKIGLQDYLKMEGMAFRLVPEKRIPGREFVNEKVLKMQLAGNTNPRKDYKPCFRYTGLNDPNIFFDDNHIRMIQNYRNGFMRLAVHYRGEGNNSAVIKTLDDMNEKLPPSILKIDNGLLFEIANLYFISGAVDRYKEIIVDVEKTALEELERNPSDVSSYYNPYRILIDTYENLQEYDKLLGIWEKLELMFPNDPTVKANIQRYRQMLMQPDTLNPR
jgi:tetratricopeptide (TPR) repeat protein